MDGRDANDLVSMPIVAAGAGRELGRVKEILFDPERQALLGVTVASGGENGHLFLDGNRIRSIGADAILVDGDEELRPVSDVAAAQGVMASGIYLKGATVLTEDGDSIGKVDKIMISRDGRIAGYATASGLLGLGEKRFIEARHVLKIGQDAIIVSQMAHPDASARRQEADPSMER